MGYFGNDQKFGFGCMRLPMIGEEVDLKQFKEMVDLFIESGFKYFDTAHGYLKGLSELAIKECLTSRYSRDKYFLTNKLTEPYFNKEEDIRPFFMDQLARCGVDYFDFYLMHAQNKRNFEHFKRCKAYETAFELKKEGKIKHVGISFHDTADVLDNILTTYPEIEVVQIQYNYLDYDSKNTQSRLCREVCEKHQKPIIIMEPIKGGRLINLPPKALEFVKEEHISPANLALRFAANPSSVMMVLSGMSTLEQMKENLSFMKDVKPLSSKEVDLAFKIRDIIIKENLIPCTSCKYCVEGCPQKIAIPNIFDVFNADRVFNDWSAKRRYREEVTLNSGLASSCIKCGKCERVCPQKLPIRELLAEVAKAYE